ncbi:Beta-barrel assembly machine subunit BamE [Gilliamella bombicola]|uniref:Outer membrane protein assembly factor BamE n=1 Tax=Gilliamella bombicola TaxID=1798182 RepID=A0A1C4CQS7_9GAMM|nr:MULTISPECIES: outer membrane protein assembly factor BamE [Gilliamella]NUF26812.1 outer membrane protein assembly factor BamE [Gilliamella sp. ESL0254]SCC21379.1 Beta-barrel assembly machine subunit BamE [Gilliamella bombicola]
MLFRKFTAFAIVTSVLLTGCSVVEHWIYRPDINQGNYVTQDALDLLKVGQSKEQVVFIMGSPMLTSVFGDNVWYYVFRQQPQHGDVSQRSYAVYFDEMGLVKDIKASELDGSKSLEEMNKQGISDPIDKKSDDDNPDSDS